MARRNRRRTFKGRKYAPAVQENVNVLTLFKDDFNYPMAVSSGSGSSGQKLTGNSIAAMLVNAGLGTILSASSIGAAVFRPNKAMKIRVIGAAFPATVKHVEVAGDGTSYYSTSEDKPMRIKIGKNDLIDHQWLTITAGDHTLDSAIGNNLGGLTYNYCPFGGDVSVNAGTVGLAESSTLFDTVTIGIKYI